ncbi:uncharacterized protein LOC125379294 [Haliotis rufescens]|uniref:uncharacterized protein LOC125379294 n=1 Tax=Haliotis rufescens TaxID=6454 RepID=UPI00201F3368|nr:uncharacterized protein LOC125379294 [Haliotis rufescens]
MSLFLEYNIPVTLMLQAGFHCNIVLVDTRWRVGSRGAEYSYYTMATNTSTGSSKANKRRHLSSSSDEELSQIFPESWPRFLVISTVDESPLKLNPFAISKGIQSACGEVKNVTRLRGGSILVECARRQQSVNLLDLQQFVNTQVVVSAHKTLNSSRGIVRDRARCLSDMTEGEIADELQNQGVTAVKRFTRKTQDGTIVNTQTYLFTFSVTTLPKFIKAGYFNIGVEVYVPNPLRCYKCQKFGHGAKTCTNKARCFRCSETHESSECTNEIRCANCNGEHLSSSKSCPAFDRETKILRIKHTNNISYTEAKKLLLPSQTPSTKSYSAAVSSPVQLPKVTTVSTHCQTSISWLKDDIITLEDSIHISKDLPQISSSATQTETIHTPPTEPNVAVAETRQGNAHLSNKAKKQMRRKAKTLQHLEVPSPVTTTVEVHNPFEPLEMDVTPTQPVHESGRTSRSRSPVEPP